MSKRILISIALAALAAIFAGCSNLPNRTQAGARTDSPAPAADAQAEPTTKAEEYRIGPGDTLKIMVYNNPDLTTEAEVTQSGTINFPLVGDVKLGGLARRDAERLIAQRLDKGGFVKRPHVNMLVTQYRSQQVSVLGEVNKPGMYPLSQSSTVTDLLAAAGGITAKGSTLVTVIRKDEKGTAHRYQVDVNNVWGTGDVSKNFTVARGDIIHVPPTPVFYIYGEVRQPGAYPLAPSMTIRQALSVGGGLTARGTERGIKVDRKGAEGEIKTYRAQLTDKLQPDDVVNVPESWF